MRTNKKHLYVVGLQIKTDEFDPNRPHSGCRICGAVYQTERDRTIVTLEDAIQALQLRRLWQQTHPKTHSSTQHGQLLLSGRLLTPEAAQELASRGVVSLTDLVMDDEVEDAYRTAKRAAVKEVNE